MPVHFMMDEFANVSLPDDFDKILSIMRSVRLSDMPHFKPYAHNAMIEKYLPPTFTSVKILFFHHS